MFYRVRARIVSFFFFASNKPGLGFERAALSGYTVDNKTSLNNTQSKR